MKTLLVSHDSGGAQVLSSWVARQEDLSRFIFSVQGPALEIFSEKIETFQNLEIGKAISTANSIITTTSWASDIEISALKRFKDFKISNSVVLLDHWTNYRERFLYEDQLILPNEIWVTDHFASELAIETFPKIPVSRIHNYYLEEVIEKISDLQINCLSDQVKTKLEILFIGENISANCERTHGNANYFGYTEQESFIYFLDRINKFGNLKNIVLTIRSHPSETAEKYISLIPAGLKRELNYFISTNSLEMDLAKSDLVVGMSSFALYISVNAQIRTLCVIPDSSIKCVIPDPRIERF
jgi:hypothetical protein